MEYVVLAVVVSPFVLLAAWVVTLVIRQAVRERRIKKLLAGRPSYEGQMWSNIIKK